MRIIGLTGSIGMGKSVTATLLKYLGVPVHDSDAVVHEALSPKGGAFREVITTFPQAFDKKNNRIDRGHLGKIIFADPVKRLKLEAIIHPHVWASQRAFIRKTRRMRVKRVVLDIPLLFETGADQRCDEVICVTAPYFLQRQRVLARTGMSRERFENILKNQIPDHEKRKRSNYVVQTGLGRAHSLQTLKKILKTSS